MERKRCTACKRSFHPRPQTPRQTYCKAPACQRERRRRWQQQKRHADPDYRENQARAQRAWLERNPDSSGHAGPCEHPPQSLDLPAAPSVRWP